MSTVTLFLKKFFDRDDHEELIVLLMGAPISEKERIGWIKMLPLMTSEEKAELRENVIKTIDYFNSQKDRLEDAISREAGSTE
ncbi:MAG: hypothetical protein AAB592_02225 [Patescibacteria group bacterium]